MPQTPLKTVSCATRPAIPDAMELHRLVSRVSRIAHQARSDTIPQQSFPRLIKRSFDLVLASLMLIVLMPVFLILALLIKRDGGPAFFRQQRVGQNHTLFDCYKFRSMRADAEGVLADYLANNHLAAMEWKKFQKLKNDIRVTKFGHFIRRTSLDELPQLINVLKGDMSFVGPRPCTPDQADFYADDFDYYASVRPGITGPWQISGRNKLFFQQRVALESWYVQHWSLGLDIIILAKTIPTLLRKDGAF